MSEAATASPVAQPAAAKSPVHHWQLACGLIAMPTHEARLAAMTALPAEDLKAILCLTRDAFPIAIAGATWILRQATRASDEIGYQMAVHDLQGAIYPILNEESRAILRRQAQ